MLSDLKAAEFIAQLGDLRLLKKLKVYFDYAYTFAMIIIYMDPDRNPSNSTLIISLRLLPLKLP